MNCPPSIIDQLFAVYWDYIPPNNKARFLAVLKSGCSNSIELNPDPRWVTAALNVFDEMLEWWRPLPNQQRKARGRLRRACVNQLTKEKLAKVQRARRKDGV